MRFALFAVLFLLLSSFAVLGADSFEIAKLSGKIDRIPQETEKLCRKDVEAGLKTIEAEVDARVSGLPVMIGVYASAGALIGMLLGSALSLFFFKNYRLRVLRYLRSITEAERRKVEALKVQKSSGEKRNKSGLFGVIFGVLLGFIIAVVFFIVVLRGWV